MNVRKLMQGLSYSGKVKGKRQTYHVFEGSTFFLVLSFSRTKRNAGNFNAVETAAVDYVQERCAGTQGVTTSDVVQKGRRSRHVPNALAALNILYVLAATGRASIDTRRAGPKLFFNVRR
ncbi:MAG: hypothetical protein ACRD3M_18155 [Thermoanaerobaculia bacterium]